VGAPAVNVTVVFLVTVPAVARERFYFALVDAKVAVNTPKPFVVRRPANTCSRFPVLDNKTAWPGTGFPVRRTPSR